MYSELEGLIYFDRFSKFVGYGTVYEYVFRGISEEEAERYGFRLSYVVTDSIGTACTFEYTALNAVYELLDGVGTFVDRDDEESLCRLKSYLFAEEDEQQKYRIRIRIEELGDAIEEMEEERREWLDVLDRLNN